MKLGDLAALTTKAGFEIVASDRLPSISGSWRECLKRDAKYYEVVSDRDDGCFGMWLGSDMQPKLLFGGSVANLNDALELEMLEQWLIQVKSLGS